MSQLRASAFAVAGAAIGITLWQWLSEDPPPAIPKAEIVKEYVIAPPRTHDPGEVLFNLAASVPAAQPLAPAVKTSEFGRKLLETKDVKAFVIDALKHPEKGGAFYASLALHQCDDSIGDLKKMADATIQKVVATESTISQERMDAINSGVVRCVGFSDGEVATLRNKAFQHGMEGRDPLFAKSLHLTLIGDGIPELSPLERDKAMDDIYKSGSPALISDTTVISRLIEMATTTERGVTTVRFNGQTYGKDDLPILQVGAFLSTCVDGDYCAMDAGMLGECWSTGACYDSRDEFVRQTMLDGDQAAFDKAAKIGNEIRAAIARGDRSIFH